jgi:hypothetical protein
MSVAGRIAAASDMIATAHTLLRAGLRRRHPGLSYQEEQVRVADLWFAASAPSHPPDEYRRAYARRQESPRMKTALDALLQIVDYLNRLGIPYLLGGSWASMAHGIPRATQDADLLVQLTSSDVEPLLALLAPDFYVSPEAIAEAIRRGASFNVIPLGLAFKIDLFVAPDQPYEKEELARRVAYQITDDPPRFVFVATPEDVILSKLRWYRLGGEQSERQWSDIQGVLRVQEAALDQGYLRLWAGTLGVHDLLAGALDEAGIAQGPE